ncbi:hypothetical protein SDRG_05071 [Saprolegnia diclina VS20]|uniref:Uncharacterized protein n=1 Tax=Saprolegnia diclina (strain VS20) TaxID=1156394 RepID=T0RY70_SAPDV|nr:hypothetical protein SDRG_05071 [Saprolegnia diclina VS20]EQC37468.1 hypothetical protein SDRG_05071 [Saprolegnia diclina VS20]|eukprot:XP_008608988.1 hypothetical protein SDRG_05071 [Saprolegnia diclina VS20]
MSVVRFDHADCSGAVLYTSSPGPVALTNCTDGLVANANLTLDQYLPNLQYMTVRHPDATVEVVVSRLCVGTAPASSPRYVYADCHRSTFGAFSDSNCTLPMNTASGLHATCDVPYRVAASLESGVELRAALYENPDCTGAVVWTTTNSSSAGASDTCSNGFLAGSPDAHLLYQGHMRYMTLLQWTNTEMQVLDGLCTAISTTATPPYLRVDCDSLTFGYFSDGNCTSPIENAWTAATATSAIACRYEASIIDNADAALVLYVTPDCANGIVYATSKVWGASNGTTAVAPGVCATGFVAGVSVAVDAYLRNVQYMTIDHAETGFTEVVVDSVCIPTSTSGSTYLLTDCSSGQFGYFSDENCVHAMYTGAEKATVVCSVLRPTSGVWPTFVHTLQALSSPSTDCNESAGVTYAMTNNPNGLRLDVPVSSATGAMCDDGILTNDVLSSKHFVANATYMVLQHAVFTEAALDLVCVPVPSGFLYVDCADDGSYGYFGDVGCTIPLTLTPELVDELAITNVTCVVLNAAVAPTTPASAGNRTTSAGATPLTPTPTANTRTTASSADTTGTHGASMFAGIAVGVFCVATVLGGAVYMQHKRKQQLHSVLHDVKPVAASESSI